MSRPNPREWKPVPALDYVTREELWERIEELELEISRLQSELADACA